MPNVLGHPRDEVPDGLGHAVSGLAVASHESGSRVREPVREENRPSEARALLPLSRGRFFLDFLTGLHRLSVHRAVTRLKTGHDCMLRRLCRWADGWRMKIAQVDLDRVASESTTCHKVGLC